MIFGRIMKPEKEVEQELTPEPQMAVAAVEG